MLRNYNNYAAGALKRAEEDAAACHQKYIGTEHILYNNKFYELKTVKEYQIQISKPIVVSLKSKKKINTSKTHSPSNSPWRKGLPPLVSHRSMNYAVNHGC